MLSWFVRGSLAAASWVTALFVARDAENFGVVNVFVAVLLLTFGLSLVAFWPMIRDTCRTFYEMFRGKA